MVALLAHRPSFSAQVRMARIAPRKMRLIVDLVRGRNYNSALAILRAMPQRGAAYGIKLLKSAFANASERIKSDAACRDIDPDDLCLVEARVDTGPTIWGMRASSMRRPQWIHRRTSHIRFVLQAHPKPPEQPPREGAAKAESKTTPKKRKAD
jgi:large subunit ribosomal protein L22